MLPHPAAHARRRSKRAASGAQPLAPTLANMSNALLPPKTRLAPTQIARETFVVHDHEGEGQGPFSVAMNTLVIRGAEPVVVDTGLADNEVQFLADVFSLVEPEDLRWVFISHDDIDHTGNVNALMAAAPNATLVVNWYLQQRMGSTLAVPPGRQRWVGDGDVLDVGDRKLLAVRPPAYDSPTTRGLYDTTTGVYWSSDAFGVPMPQPVADIADVPDEMIQIGIPTFTRFVAPWIEIADPVKYAASVDRVAALTPSVIAGGHNPVIRGEHVDLAIDLTRWAATADILPQADQSVLEEIQRQMGAFAA